MTCHAVTVDAMHSRGSYITRWPLSVAVWLKALRRHGAMVICVLHVAKQPDVDAIYTALPHVAVLRVSCCDTFADVQRRQSSPMYGLVFSVVIRYTLLT